jgi:hypothetical protein
MKARIILHVDCRRRWLTPQLWKLAKWITLEYSWGRAGPFWRCRGSLCSRCPMCSYREKVMLYMYILELNSPWTKFNFCGARVHVEICSSKKNCFLRMRVSYLGTGHYNPCKKKHWRRSVEIWKIHTVLWQHKEIANLLGTSIKGDCRIRLRSTKSYVG